MPDPMMATAIHAAREAGRALVDGMRGEIVVDAKSRRDVKLAMDRAAEKAIIDTIKATFPDHAILSEEIGRIGGRSDYLWIIDPLDGTYNYSQRLPCWCTSIALTKGDEEIVGVIYDPLRNECFSAERGSGAFLNDQPIHVSDTKDLAYAMVYFGAGHGDRNIPPSFRAANTLATCAGKIRALGAAATHMAYVSAGRGEAFFEFGIKRWDIAAGLVIAREAGAEVSMRPGEDDAIDIVVSNGRFHEALLDAIHW